MKYKKLVVATSLLTLPYLAVAQGGVVGDGIPVQISGTVTEELPQDICRFDNATTLAIDFGSVEAGGPAPVFTDTVEIACEGLADIGEYTLSTSTNGVFTSYQVLVNQQAPDFIGPQLVTGLTAEEAQLLGISRGQVNMRANGDLFRSASLNVGPNEVSARLHGVTNPFQLDPDAIGSQETTSAAPAYPGNIQHYPDGFQDYTLYLWVGDREEAGGPTGTPLDALFGALQP